MREVRSHYAPWFRASVWPGHDTPPTLDYLVRVGCEERSRQQRQHDLFYGPRPPGYWEEVLATMTAVDQHPMVRDYFGRFAVPLAATT